MYRKLTLEETTVSRTVGRNVQRFREQMEISRVQLCEQVRRLGCPLQPASLLGLERGAHSGGQHKRVSVDELVVLAAVLGVSPMALLAESGADR